jgi:hypothetical protein
MPGISASNAKELRAGDVRTASEKRNIVEKLEDSFLFHYYQANYKCYQTLSTEFSI